MAKAFQQMISPDLFRAARALLNLSRKECAEMIGISAETVKNIEHGIFVPSALTIEKILNGFASKGVKIVTRQVASLENTPIQIQVDFARPVENAVTEVAQ